MNPRDPVSRSSSSEGLPRQRETELIEAAARLFRTGFPNPDRTDCPGTDALRALARRRLRSEEQQGINEHLTCCSPCFAEYEQFLHNAKVLNRVKILALCASVVIAAGVAVWFYAFRDESGRRKPEPSIVRKEPVPERSEFQIVVLDLKSKSPVRGEQQPSQTEDVVAALPTRSLELSVYLPIGSEEGEYEMQILREVGTPFVTQRGTASYENREVVLRIRVDLTGFTSGRYLLRLRKANFRWTYYPIVLAQ